MKKYFLKYKNLFFLIIIFLVSLFLRLYKQPQYPSCLHRDEVHFAYNAYSILKTAKDEWGDFMPLHFKFNGEDHVPTIFYLMAGSFAIFGVNDISVRMPAIILGSLIPILGFLLVRQIYDNKKLSYIFAILLAINPWQVINARASGEISIISLFFGIIGIIFLFQFIKKQKNKYLFLSCFNLILAYFSYIASRLDVPLLISLFIFIFYKQIPKKKLSLPVIVITTIILPIFLVINHPKRFQGTSIFSTHIQNLNQKLEANPSLFQSAKIYLKAGRDIGFEFIDNYFDYLSPVYIFRNMGNPDRTNIRDIGPLYPLEIIFVIYGIYFLSNLNKTKNRNSKVSHFILLSIFLTPIVGSLTHNYPDQPNTARTVYFYFFLSLLSAIGIYNLSRLFRNIKIQNIAIIFIFSILTINCVYMGNQLLDSPTYLGKARSCGYKELFAFLEDQEQNYSHFYIGTEYDWPYVFQLWYGRYNPQEHHKYLEEEKPVVVFPHTMPKEDWSLGKYGYTHYSCPLKDQPGDLLIGNFNHCKEKKGIRVYADGNDRLLFKGGEINQMLSRDRDYIIFKKVTDFYDTGDNYVFNAYEYIPELDVEISQEEMSNFEIVDTHRFQEI